MDAAEPVSRTTPDASVGAQPDPERRSALLAVPWRWGDVFLGLAPYVLVNLASRLVGPAAISEHFRRSWIPIALLALGWAFAFPLWMARRRGAGWPRRPRLRAFLLEGSIGLLATPVIFLIIALVASGLTFAFGKPAEPGPTFEGLFQSPARYEPIVLTILAVFLGPIAEEVLFRGMVYGMLRRRLPIVPAAVLQAIVFGLLHPFDLVTGLYIALFGFFLALIYEWRKTLLAPIALHMAWNALAMAMMAWSAAEYVEGPMLGVRGGPEATSCRVIEVVPGGAADIAGLKINDVIIAVDREAITDFRSLSAVVASRKAGDRVVIEFDRNNERLQVEATLRRRRD